MIRITANKESDRTRLLLEGKLAGPCVSELEKCWLTSSKSGEIVVDLTSVSYIDEGGKELLTKMHDKGINLVSDRLMTKCLIEEIEGDGSSRKSV
jgi:anti-anti-sigma regulatory factor